MATSDAEWTTIYETKSAIDADLVRTTLEVAGYRVSVENAQPSASFIPTYVGPATLSIAVPAEDADDAREFLRQKTSLLPVDAASSDATEEEAAQPESLAAVTQEILDLRRQHEIAACRYCGIPTLEVRETDLDSRMIALLRAAGLGVNSATFDEFEPGERICSACAGHEVTCDLCGRDLDAFLDEGEYRQANDDEGYVCSTCRGRLEDQLQAARDW
jgi:Putative prokaryotic signal transducing protein